MDGKFVAIKMHFGELGNISYLRPNYAKAVADVVKELAESLPDRLQHHVSRQPQKRAGAPGMCLGERLYSPFCSCPILIGDGLKGTDDIDVPVNGGEYVKNAKIGRAVMDADVLFSLTHLRAMK